MWDNSNAINVLKHIIKSLKTLSWRLYDNSNEGGYTINTVMFQSIKALIA